MTTRDRTCLWVADPVLVASGSAWIMGADRAQAAACLDGAGPQVLGRISERSGVPVVMGLVSGGVSFLLMVLSLWVTGGDSKKYFSLALNVAISLIVLAYLFGFEGQRVEYELLTITPVLAVVAVVAAYVLLRPRTSPTARR